ncbi:Ataxin-10 [Coemansia sp. RSA 2618]|nr:Ataxin-10 [Coemansia sp. RSA 2618]
MEHKEAQNLHANRRECALLKGDSPHPSRPHLPATVSQETWHRVHTLFRHLLSSANNNNEDLDIDPLAPVWSDALADLCLFARNAFAMDESNQDLANHVGIVTDITDTIRLMLRCEMTYVEAKRCGTVAGQALSNVATDNKAIQRQLMEGELRDCREPIESVYWYLLASTDRKTNVAGMMLVLNAVKDDAELTKLLCLSEAGQVLVRKIGEMFGDSCDDEDDEKTMMYVILAQVIGNGYLGLLLTSDSPLDAYGLLNALAVYCNENSGVSAGGGGGVYSKVVDARLLASIDRVLAKCHDLLQSVWQSAQTEDCNVDMEDIMAAHRSLAFTVSILGTITTDLEQRFAARILDSGIINQVVALLGLLSQNLPRIEKASTAPGNNGTLETKDDSIKRLFMFKGNLIQIIGNISYHNPSAQDLVRELDGLALVLDHMRIDENHPFIKEYAVVALRSLLENNAANQAYVSNMEAKGVVQDPKLASAGVQATLGPDGRLSVKKG